MIGLKAGTEEDHALLMASIFRTVKHEDMAEYTKFVKAKKKDLVTRADKDKTLLATNTENPHPDDGAEKIVGELTTKGETTTGGGGDGTPDTKAEETKTEEKKDKKKGDLPNETIDDRVFVCIGKTPDELERKVWVMTYDRTFNIVNFWECKNHKMYVLRGRVKKG